MTRSANITVLVLSHNDLASSSVFSADALPGKLCYSSGSPFQDFEAQAVPGSSSHVALGFLLHRLAQGN